MATAVHIPLSEYLTTTYRPDCDYVDGEVVERNVGTQSHSILQTLLARWFDERFDQYGCVGATEQRLQVAGGRYRVPDVCALIEGAGEQVVTSAPLVCIEILSPDDTLPSLQERIDDYLRMGVANVWIFDPVKHLSWIATEGGILHPYGEPVLPVIGLDIALELPLMYDALERRLHRRRDS